MIERRQFYIDGQWVDPARPNDLDVYDPATEEACAVISLGSEADLDRAVAAARNAFTSWSTTSPAERRAMLEKLGVVMKRRLGDLGEAMSLEMGAPIDFAIGEQAGTGPYHLRGFLKAFDAFDWDARFTDRETIIREPIGVCGLITPWNWPVNQIALKVIPAVATGCTCVLKPSEIAPLSAIVFAEIMEEVGFPPGVFNLVNGDGPTVGEAISNHPDIDMISFTGSTRAGRAVMAGGAGSIKRVTLELGGKSPNIIFADADLEKAVRWNVANVVENTGQSCNAPTRMIVERSVYENVVALAVDTANAVQVDSPRNRGDHIGPLVSAAQFEKVQALIEAGIKEGARLVAGGPGRPEGFNRGWYARPTVFADVSNDMTIAREEIFGPVLSILPFSGDEDEAVAIANDTPYGLAANLWTSDAEKGDRVGRRLRAGMVRVNASGLSAGHPFGGYKQSGNGREGGVWGLEDFTEVKVLSQA